MTDLLSSVIAAHGGLDRWHTVRAIDVTFNFSGGLLDLKGYPGHRRPSASVDAATPRTVFQRLGVWSRSVGESVKLILHSGRPYGTDTPRQRHDHARGPSCNTAIEGSAQRVSRPAWAKSEDGRQVA